MKTIETHVTVAPDGKIGVPAQVSSDLAPGEHRALLVIQEDVKTAAAASKPPLRLHILDEKPPLNTSFRREDIYGGLRPASRSYEGVQGKRQAGS